MGWVSSTPPARNSPDPRVLRLKYGQRGKEHIGDIFRISTEKLSNSTLDSSDMAAYLSYVGWVMTTSFEITEETGMILVPVASR